MSKLILIRHGETLKNADGTMHGLDDPTGLTENGRRQMALTAKALKEYLPFTVYSSKEIRAIESASIIVRKYNLSVATIDGLEERNWGGLTNKSWPEVKKILEKMTLENRFEFVPPNGESWKDFENRLTEAIKGILDNCPLQSAVIVTHGGAIRALIPCLLKISKDESFKYNPDNASLSIFNKTSEDTFSAALINGTAHLI
ncbi:MAG: histidine phosphatase family protein [bacterium]